MIKMSSRMPSSVKSVATMLYAEVFWSNISQLGNSGFFGLTFAAVLKIHYNWVRVYNIKVMSFFAFY